MVLVVAVEAPLSPRFGNQGVSWEFLTIQEASGCMYRSFKGARDKIIIRDFGNSKQIIPVQYDATQLS